MFPIIYNNLGITDDKVMHFIIGFIIGLLLKNFGFKNLITISILLGIALFKEYIDYFSPKHNVELLDIFYTVLGGIIGVITFYLSIVFHITNFSKDKEK